MSLGRPDRCGRSQKPEHLLRVLKRTRAARTRHEKMSNVGYMPDFHPQAPHRNVAIIFLEELKHPSCDVHGVQ